MKTYEFALSKINKVALSKGLGVVVFSVLLGVASLIKIPLFFTPVPVTLQTLIVFLAGAMLGPWPGAVSVALYIAMGFLGVPLFANAGFGLAYLLGPTGGYLFGFLCAAWAVGQVSRAPKTKNFVSMSAAMLVGLGLIYVWGGLWLHVGYGWDVRQVFLLGIAPFIVGDVMKALVAALLTAGRKA